MCDIKWRAKADQRNLLLFSITSGVATRLTVAINLLVCLLPFVVVFHFCLFMFFITPHAQREWGKVIDRGVHIYVCSRKKYLNRTLEIDSPSQMLTVGLLVKFID